MRTQKFVIALILTLFSISISCAGSGSGSSNNNNNDIEICNNGIDDDNDHLVDCTDSDCYNDPYCIGSQEICNNSIDDDSDGAIDCDDMDCNSSSYCGGTPEICNNGIDDDGDNAIDCSDADCNSDANCLGSENCNNGIDDDGDNFIDCADTDCITAANCNVSEDCSNNIDDDGDNLIDCNDPDCTNDVACNATCDDTVIYQGSGDTCPGDEQCGIFSDTNGDLDVGCLPDANFAGGTVYGDCGANGECPFGSICNGIYGCTPYCDSVNDPPTHTCPSNGICLFEVTLVNTHKVGLCKSLDNCDVVADNCGTGLQCMGTASGAICLEPGAGLGVGTSCTYIDDCGSGLVCVGTCEQGCNNPGGTDAACNGGSCGDLVDGNGNSLGLPFGVCN